MMNTVRGTDEHKLGDLLKQLLAAYGLDDKLTEIRLKEAWYTVVGPMAKRYTERIKIKDKVMFVNLSSAALRYELSLSKEMLLLNLQREAEAGNYLRDIVLR